MAKKTIRLFVELEPALYEDVKSLSHTNCTTGSMAARELMSIGCERIEEAGLVALAETRVASAKGRRWLRQNEVWK